MNYKIILKTSSRHKERISSCLNTWLKELDYIFLTDIPLGGIGEEFSGSNRIDYSSNEEKTVTFINHCITDKKYLNYDWFIFIDDDAILNKKAVEYILPYLDKQYVYGLLMGGSWPKDTTLNFPSGGSGYFISPKLIDTLTPMIIRGHGQEDVSMGEWLRDNHIGLRDFYTIDDQKIRLKLNGWYPFSKLKEKHSEFANDECKISEFIDNDHLLFIKKHIIHHYIRKFCLMEYIYNTFKITNKEYLEQIL